VEEGKKGRVLFKKKRIFHQNLRERSRSPIVPLGGKTGALLADFIGRERDEHNAWITFAQKEGAVLDLTLHIGKRWNLRAVPEGREGEKATIMLRNESTERVMPTTWSGQGE